jgi:adhesin transport system outer membrane protein
MNMRAKRNLRFLSFRLTMLTTALLLATGAQAVTLPELLRAAAATHPTVQSARQSVNAATEDVEAVRRQYWPTMSATLEQGRLTSVGGPTRLLRADQTLWDFGRIKANVAASEHTVDATAAALEGQQQAIGLQVIEAWRTLQGSYGRLRISEEMLQRLQAHESMMLRRVAGELSTQVDLDLVRSRILQGRVEVTQAKTSIKVAITRLQNLTGLPNLDGMLAVPPPLPTRTEIDARFQLLLKLIDWDDAANRQPAVVKAQEEFRAGQERINAKSAEAFPQVYARLDQAVSGRKETAAYLGLRYSPGAGFSTAVEANALAARALALELSVQAARIDARQTLDVDRDDLRDNGVRAQALESAVQGAQRVFESYERQFTAGRKSWIDLMNAVREVAQNAYSLTDAHAAQAAALYRLQLRTNPELIDVAVALPDDRRRIDDNLRPRPPRSGRDEGSPADPSSRPAADPATGRNPSVVIEDRELSSQPQSSRRIDRSVPVDGESTTESR